MTENELGWNINDYLRKNQKQIQPVTKVTIAVQQQKPYIMKVLLILILISTIHSTMTNKRMKRQTKEKDFNLNFGLSTALKERLHPEIIEKVLLASMFRKSSSRSCYPQ